MRKKSQLQIYTHCSIIIRIIIITECLHGNVCLVGVPARAVARSGTLLCTGGPGERPCIPPCISAPSIPGPLLRSGRV